MSPVIDICLRRGNLIPEATVVAIIWLLPGCRVLFFVSPPPAISLCTTSLIH